MQNDCKEPARKTNGHKSNRNEINRYLYTTSTKPRPIDSDWQLSW